jgi:hypothetical protein
MFKLLALSILTALVASSCTSSDEVKEIDTKLDVKNRSEGREIGINDDDEAIIQEKTDADDELRALEMGNMRLFDNLQTDYNELKRCREDLADPRLGGNGEVTDIPEIDKMKNLAEVKEEFGLDDEGKLKVVKRQKFSETLAQEQKYQKSLKSMQGIVSKYRVECERKMRVARTAKGLPAQRYTAQGYFDGSGAWVETRKAELTLDDAFEIKAKSTKQAPKKAAASEEEE